MTGAVSYQAGLAAEDIIERHYAMSGHELVERRWRGKAGEIDLIVRSPSCLIFVEVKKSHSLAAAAERLGAPQIARLRQSACAYLGDLPEGQDTDMRFDVALVDDAGRFEIIENALQP